MKRRSIVERFDESAPRPRGRITGGGAGPRKDVRGSSESDGESWFGLLGGDRDLRSLCETDVLHFAVDWRSRWPLGDFECLSRLRLRLRFVGSRLLERWRDFRSRSLFLRCRGDRDRESGLRERLRRCFECSLWSLSAERSSSFSPSGRDRASGLLRRLSLLTSPSLSRVFGFPSPDNTPFHLPSRSPSLFFLLPTPSSRSFPSSSLPLFKPLSSPLNRALVSAFSFASSAALWLSAFLTKFLRNLVLGFGAFLSRLVAVREDPSLLASASLRRSEMMWSSSMRGVSMVFGFVTFNRSS